MDFLTLQSIKKQLQLEPDFAEDDELLEEYGESAEETIYNYIGRTFDELMEKYGKMPTPLKHAALMLVGISYQYREPVTPMNTARVPFTFDFLIKPYMKLTSCN